MKKTLLILCALLLTAVGASAQVDYTSYLDNGTWTGNSGTYQGGVERYGEAITGSTSSPTKVLYETVTGLPAGTYTLQFYAVANNAWVGSATGDNIAQVYVTAGGTTQTQGVTVYDQTACGLGSDDYLQTFTFTVSETSNTLEYGLQNVGNGGNWYLCQGWNLTRTDETTPTLETDAEVYNCEADITHWATTGNNGTFVVNDWSTEADESGMKTPFCQNWVYEGDDKEVLLTTAKISHRPLTGLAKGFYEVSIDIRIFSEAGNKIGTGTSFNANEATEDLDQTDIDGHEGNYGTATEVYGTYTLIAEVTTDGTLDISIQLPEEPTYNWIAWKNLKVEYLGETIEYEIHEPECSAKVVQPGDEVSIVYECITPDTNNEPTLDTSKSITVGTATVTLDKNALDCAGYSATVTFTIPESITVGEDITISVPAGLIYWDLQEADVTAENVLSPAATFTVHTPATITDGDYLIMNSDGNYLGGGLAWGTQAATIGKPQFFTFEAQTDGTYTLDSHQSNGGESHYLGAGLYCDAESAHWTLVAIDGGYALYYAGADSYVKDNGFQVAATLSDEPSVWTLVTKDEIIAKMADATEENPVDVTALIPSCEPKRNAWGDVQTTGAWTVTGYNVTAVPANYSFGQNGNVASCTESYYSNNGFDIRQSVTFPKKGVYVLSAQAFYSGTAGAVMYVSSSDGTGYNTDGNSVALPAQGSTSANNMVTAYQEFLEELHTVSLQFTVDADETALYVGFSSAATSNSAWNIFGELGLQYLGVVEETISWEMTDAGWGTLILPFDAEIPSGLTAYAGDALTLDEDGTTITVSDASDAIEANTPYLVNGTDAKTYEFTGVATNTQDSYTSGMLTGTLVDLSQADGTLSTDGTEYVLQNHNDEGLAFYPITTASTGVTLDAYHCYLTISSGVSPTALHLPGMATGIVAVEGAEAEANGAIYDLSGRRVSKAVKGVYIQNGKKVLVK